MKFVLACYGTRGDAEPGLAVGRELLRRGHEVCMAVSPDQVGFAESAGLTAVAYGPDSQTALDSDFGANLFKDFPRGSSTMKDLTKLWREYWAFVTQCWVEMTKTLISLADGADLLFTGLLFEDGAANVAEYYGIPLATLHYFPLRPNGQLLTFLPAPLSRSAMTMFWWLSRGVFGKLEDAQRRKLGLPRATGPAPGRITERGALEIQAYDEVCFPGLAAEWAKWHDQRPFVGTLTLELPTAADEKIASWIAAGTPPICFAFGSMPMESPADTLAMISAACAQLGERALVCSAWTDFSNVAQCEHIKVVSAMNYAAIFPSCRAVVHHGGAGTTAAGLRAGVPTLILWAAPDRQMWGALIKQLKVGTARRFSATTEKSLVTDLSRILTSGYATRVRELATRITKPAESVTITADLVEDFARRKRFS
ncbi:glycosyltransferase [Mycobacterium sp.]|uniref:glycosyltransferase n=1 Tax=Mycobacterium sp. TaxID=1785 RepID=UPI001276871B|nr:glycosyltransferase [Mycobacterium sp.]KAA8960184.1 MAG: glycosyltransferase [Mycobacterium sp.]